MATHHHRLPKPLALVLIALALWGVLLTLLWALTRCEGKLALRPARENLCFPIERTVLA